MKREVELSILDELLRQLDTQRNIDADVMYKNPTSVYTCPDVARREGEQAASARLLHRVVKLLQAFRPCGGIRCGDDESARRRRPLQD